MEDTVLFPSLLQRASDEPSVRLLIVEHNHERALVAEIEEALLSRKVTAFLQTSRRLTGMLRNHFDKEDMLLSTLDADFFTERQDEEVSAEIADLRKPVEIFTNLSRLERRYVPKSPLELPRPQRSVQLQ
jgi:hemerythrin-like domain-containing protein